jgi:hypothetical protein
MSASRLPLLLLLAAALAERAPAQTFFHLDSKATYLHVNSDAAHDSTPIALAPLGAVPGKCIRIRQFGKYDNGPGGETFTSTIGVFSADTTLLGGSLLHRVPGAIDAGLDFTSAVTWFGSQPTDIAEDFRVSYVDFTEVTVEVPAGAAWLFLSSGDQLFNDNSDPNSDWGVDITLVGCWKDLGLGLAGVNGAPVLAGTGTLLAGEPLTLALGNAKPSSSAALIVGFDQLNAPFKGGTLVPTVNLLIAGLPVDGAGSLLLPANWPAGLPSDFSLYFQAWVADAAGPHGFSASNGLSATTP